MGEHLTENKAVVLLANSIATAFGLIVLIWIFGPYSGAHFNPVVSILMISETSDEVTPALCFFTEPKFTVSVLAPS